MSAALEAYLTAVLRQVLEGGAPPPPYAEADDAPAGAFVALTVDGARRGFVGTVAPRGPFAATAAEMVRRAATEDPRVVPPAAGDAVTLAVFRVGAPRPLAGPADLAAGRDGVMVREGFHRAVHLPTGTGAGDAEAFLESACLAAGLHPEAWARPEVEVTAFPVTRILGPPLDEGDEAAECG